MENTNYNPCFVTSNHYSGPLDLLLQLIREQKKDIFQIDIHSITSRYIEHLEQQDNQANLMIAGDFIRIASILMYIKSRSLILQSDKDESEEKDLETIKLDLNRMLVVYQKFQNLGQDLYNRPLLGRDCWKSSRSLNFKSHKNTKISIQKTQGQFLLIQSYQKRLMAKRVKMAYTPKQAMPTLMHRLKQIASLLTLGSKMTFQQITQIHKEPYARLLSFLSILELSKNNFISLFQKKIFSDIEVLVKKSLSKEAISNLSQQEAISMSKKLNKEFSMY